MSKHKQNRKPEHKFKEKKEKKNKIFLLDWEEPEEIENS